MKTLLALVVMSCFAIGPPPAVLAGQVVMGNAGDALLAIGACCLPDGQCLPAAEAECSAYLGAYLGDETSCEPDPCAEHMGACCFETGACVMLMEGFCGSEEGAGSFMGRGTVCAASTCPVVALGACCLDSGECVLLSQADCDLLADADYQGDGTSCQPNPCTQVRGACCLPSGRCATVLVDWCTESRGEYFGDGSTCGTEPCFGWLPTESASWGRIKSRYR